RVIRHAQLEPLVQLQTIKDFIGQHCAFFHAGTALGLLTQQVRTQTAKGCTLNDAELFVQILAHLVQLHFLNRQSTAITLNTVASKYLYVNCCAFGTSWYAQGSVLNVGCFVTEDGAQQFFFRGQLGFALWRYLAPQDVASVNFSPYINN